MFVSIRSYNSNKKADYIKYRLERAGIECNSVPKKKTNEITQNIVSIEVLSDHVEIAVDELLKIHTEYPNEDFKQIDNPKDLLRILIPIDFSDKSYEAYKFALDIATRRAVEIKFLHVWNDELDDSFAVRNSYMVEDFKKMERNELKISIDKNLKTFTEKFKGMVTETGTHNNVLYHFTVTEGSLDTQIEQVIFQYKPQLTIVAHNTNNEYKFRISREVANSIIETEFCPVFYIPQKVYYKPFKELHIIFASNFQEEDLQSFQLLQNLTQGYDTYVRCLHVSIDRPEEDAQEKMNNLVEQIKNIKTKDIKIDSNILTNARLLDGFDSFIKDKHIDMIAFASQKHGIWHKLFNPDNLSDLMKGSSLPLLIFRFKDQG